MNYEQRYDSMHEGDIEGMDIVYADWIAEFEQAKSTGDDSDVYHMILGTESKYCIWKILQYLKTIAELESSDDPSEHWRGFLAKTNMRICRDKLKGEYKD